MIHALPGWMLRTVNLLLQMLYLFLQLQLLLLEPEVFHAKLLVLSQTFEHHFLTCQFFHLPFSDLLDIFRNRCKALYNAFRACGNFF